MSTWISNWLSIIYYLLYFYSYCFVILPFKTSDYLWVGMNLGCLPFLWCTCIIYKISCCIIYDICNKILYRYSLSDRSWLAVFQSSLHTEVHGSAGDISRVYTQNLNSCFMTLLSAARVAPGSSLLFLQQEIWQNF